MNDEQKPDFITVNADGGVTVALPRPLEVSGVAMPSLTMREPTVGDQLAVAKGASDAAREVALFSNLCGIPPEDLQRLPMRGYARLQVAYRDFLT